MPHDNEAIGGFAYAADMLIRHCGEPGPREGLKETPARFAKAFAHWTSGYDADPAQVLKAFSDGACDEMVVLTDIPVYSLCEHHLAPFFGVAHIGYIPFKRVVGLSKLSRLTDIFARRLQVQERLTTQIADALWDNLDPRGVGVIVQCRHLCMESRGVARAGVVTTTTALKGAIKDEPPARAEFLQAVAHSKRS